MGANKISRLIAAALLFALGCGEPNPLGRKKITGEIMFDGSPLASGLIEFAPTDPNGVSTGGSIQNGAYEIAAHQGVPPGLYTVRITSPIDTINGAEEVAPPGPQDGGPRQPPPATERIPAEYNWKSDQRVTVTESGPNRFDFDIPAAKKSR